MSLFNTSVSPLHTPSPSRRPSSAYLLPCQFLATFNPNHGRLCRIHHDSPRSLCFQHGTRCLRYNGCEEAWCTPAASLQMKSSNCFGQPQRFFYFERAVDCGLLFIGVRALEVYVLVTKSTLFLFGRCPASRIGWFRTTNEDPSTCNTTTIFCTSVATRGFGPILS